MISILKKFIRKVIEFINKLFQKAINKKKRKRAEDNTNYPIW